MPLTPDDVRSKQFATTRLRAGYDENEVDAFLDEVEAELGRLLSENANLAARNADLEQRLAAARVRAAASAADGAADLTGQPPAAPPVEEPPEQAALRIITMAQRTADEAVADARREAESILAAARRDAEQALGEARDKQRSIIDALQAQREQLEQRVTDLESFAREHRRRLKTYLESQLRELDAHDDVSAAASVDPPPRDADPGLADPRPLGEAASG